MMKAAKNPQSEWASILPATQRQSKATVSPDYSSGKTDSYQYIQGPDGSTWHAVCHYDYDLVDLPGGLVQDKVLKGYKFTVYDSEFQEVGTIIDDIKLEGDETRCAQAQLDIAVTRKFFNYDNDYEVMVALSMNTPDYTVNTRTNVYALKKKSSEEHDTPLAVFPGYPVDAINVASDSWSENFFITFLTESIPDPDGDYPQYIDYLSQFKQVLTTYARMGANAEPTAINVREIPSVCMPGDQMSTPPMLTKNIDGKFTMIFSRYEKTLFVDPSGMSQNEDMTPDNTLQIEVVQLQDGYPKTMETISTTSIPTLRRSDDPNVLYTFYGIGNLNYDGDVDFQHYSADGTPGYVVSVEEYLLDDDDTYNTSFYVYNAKGERIKTLAEDTFASVSLSDLPGYEPQAMFIHTGDEMVFEFVDLYSGEKVCEVDQMYRGNPLTTSIDRVAIGNDYAYAVAAGWGNYDEDGNLLAPVVWLKSDGDLLRIDEIPAGEGVELARIYISKNALSPYVFNTDNEIEYLMLVKRRVNPDDLALREELLIATVKDGALQTFLPDEEKGVISTVYLMGQDSKSLVITYIDEDYNCLAESYKLPFTKFAGGNGTASNPYLIATAGDLCQIHANPNASYRLTSDIDCTGITLPAIDAFTGTFDGAQHSISGLLIDKSGKCGLFASAQNATFKDFDLYRTTMQLSGDSEAGAVCSNPIGCSFENINVIGLEARGENYSGVFGGIAGKAWSGTKISGCRVASAEIDIPKAESVGGIAGEIRTGTAIEACAFMGNITADNRLGGIVGSSSTGDEKILSCHSDAMLKGKNTVGGIAGYLKRSSVGQCYAEGTIEVSEPDRWTNALSAGGIVGELEGDWEKTGNSPILKNLVGISEIIYPKLNIQEAYPHQLATVHRIAGRTSYNAEPEIKSYDQAGNPIYKDEVIYEYGVRDNLVIADLECIDPDFSEKTIEGTSIEKSTIEPETLQEKLGFAYGNSVDAPWNLQAWNAWDPELFMENPVYMPVAAMTVAPGEVFPIEIAIASRKQYDAEEIAGTMLCDFSEEVLEMTGNMIFAENTLIIEFKALREGRGKVNVAILSGNATCTVNVKSPETGSVGETAMPSAIAVKLSGEAVTASGCYLRLVDLQGKTIKSGRDSLSLTSLAKGVYIAIATSADGETATLKFRH